MPWRRGVNEVAVTVFFQLRRPVVMGPRFREDDIRGYPLASLFVHPLAALTLENRLRMRIDRVSQTSR
jgi:hypothetical protein